MRAKTGTSGRGTPRVPPLFYQTVQDEGIALPQRVALNFTGGGVTATDDAANNRTNVNIPLGAGLNPPLNPAENNMVCWGLNGNLSYGPQIFTDGTYVGVGAAGTLAAAGNFRLPSGGSINFRNNTGLADARGISLDNATNNLMVGDTGSSNIDYTTSINHRFFVGAAQQAEISATYIEIGSASNPAASGIIRLPNAGVIRWRSAPSANDVDGITVDAAENVIVGGTNATEVRLNINAGIVLRALGGEVRVAVPLLAFGSAIALPILNQGDDTGAGAAGDTFTIHAQNTTGGTGNTGGTLILRGGNATGAGAGAIGQTIIQSGAGATVALFDTGFMSLGTAPAASGSLRLPNGAGNGFYLRNFLDTADIPGAYVSAANHLIIGGANAVAVGIDTTVAAAGNIWLHSAPASWQAMIGGMFVANVNTAPTANPAAGSFMYDYVGTGVYHNQGGIITEFAAGGSSTTTTSDRIISEVGDNASSGAVTVTLVEVPIPDGYHGLVTIDITCEEDGTPANSYTVQCTYAVSGEGGAATIRDATAVPLELDPGAVGMSFLFNTNGQNVRVQGVGVAATDFTWAAHIGGLLHER